MSPPGAAAPPITGKAGGGKGPGEFLKTREGKLVAGGAAVLVVIVLALRKGSGGAGPSADQLQGGSDGTLASQFDQLTGRGGTLEELVDTTTGLAGAVEDLRDLFEAQDPLPPTTTPPPSNAKKLASGARWMTVPGTSRRLVVVPRALTKTMSVRDIARQASTSQHPNAVESTLRGLYRLNPSLRGKTTVGRGTRIVVPDIRYYGT